MCTVEQYLHWVGLSISLSEKRRVTERGVVSSLIKNRTQGETDGQGKKHIGKQTLSRQTSIHSETWVSRQNVLIQSTANRVVHFILGYRFIYALTVLHYLCLINWQTQPSVASFNT